MQLRKLIFLFSILLMNLEVQAALVENIQGPVHEAFFSPVTGAVAYQAIATTPPEVVLERVPKQKDPNAIWIPGYWQFNEERNDFIWISGVWRNPPPDHTWISGYWKKFSEGWVWLGGFWSKDGEDNLDFIPVPPPQPVEENISDAPGADYFWSPGYWVYDSSSKKYNWVSGSWVAYDDEWVLVPAHYEWREGGYVFIAPYWDWKLEKRGTSFTSLFIPIAERTGYIYDPIVVLEPLVITHYYYSWYPDYLYFYNYHYHFYPDVWNSWGITPPWWGWNSWWSFDWHNSWALWWWWGNPGYPAPGWMSSSLAQKIAPPSKMAQAMFHDVKPPVVVTPTGVVSSEKLVDTIQENIPAIKRKPILPSNRKAIDKVAGDITKAAKISEVRPSGKLGPVPADLPKPFLTDAKQAASAKDASKLPKKPGAPDVIRSRPETPGSNLKPAIRKSVFLPKVPNLAPTLERTPQRDVFRREVEIPAGSDRSDTRFLRPDKGYSPPYNNPTRIIEPTRAPDRSATYQIAPTYIAPNYAPVYQNRNLSSDIYDLPQTTHTYIRAPSNRTLRDKRVVDPFNPEGRPSIKGKPAHFPPRPDREPLRNPAANATVIPPRDPVSPQQLQLNPEFYRAQQQQEQQAQRQQRQQERKLDRPGRTPRQHQREVYK